MTLIRVCSRQIICNLNQLAVHSKSSARRPVPSTQPARLLSNLTDWTDHRKGDEEEQGKSRGFCKYVAVVPMLMLGLVEFASCGSNEEFAGKCTP